MATTQLAMGRSPLDVQRQMGRTTLTMTNHYASLTVQHLQKSHEKYSPMRAEKGSSDEVLVRAIGSNKEHKEDTTNSSVLFMLLILLEYSVSLALFVQNRRIEPLHHQ